MRIGDDDGVVNGVAVARQARDVPRLDLDRFAESLGQIELVRARYFFILQKHALVPRDWFHTQATHATQRKSNQIRISRAHYRVMAF